MKKLRKLSGSSRGVKISTGIDEASVAGLSEKIDIEALRAYRLAVGRKTQEIVKQIQEAIKRS